MIKTNFHACSTINIDDGSKVTGRETRRFLGFSLIRLWRDSSAIEKKKVLQQNSYRQDGSNTAEVPSSALRTALSAIPFVSDLCGVDVQ